MENLNNISGLAESFYKEAQRVLINNAVEDLMKEHGLIRRLMLIFNECAKQLNRSNILKLLKPAAQIMRDFGEDFHEKILEERNVFRDITTPTLKRQVQKLIDQHKQGRTVTSYILKLEEVKDTKKLAIMLDNFVKMYTIHATIEDTVIFTAWKSKLEERELKKISRRFERLEKKYCGENAYEKHIEQIEKIEKELGIELKDLQEEI